MTAATLHSAWNTNFAAKYNTEALMSEGQPTVFVVDDDASVR